ncbi:MAG TPA: group II intron reverse transcriptase/maturase, partial [Sporomusa sp.]|nr:group II intron reverse transcriptase/maturase [Sporomusa sp.]
MKDTSRHVESRQLQIEDYLQKNRVEPEGIAGVPNVSSTSEKGQDGGNEYPENLLERILDRNNMNIAYKRVKS